MTAEYSIRFERGARDEESLSAHSRGVLLRLQKEARLPVLPITSMERTPAEQARAMFTNVRATSVARQKGLYGPAGDGVIDVYARLAGKVTDSEVIVAMTNEILRIGPSRVSRHCADQAKLQVIDVPPSKVEDAAEARLVAAARKLVTEGVIAKLLLPPRYGGNDPAIHIEIAQPGAR